MFVNLLGNAFKYTPEGGTVRVTARTVVPVPGHPEFSEMPDGYVSVEVKDSGPGIPTDELPHLFERFYRVGADGEAHGGTGIGLSLARELVELHHGRIEVESEEGFGAAFIVQLPLGRAHFDPAQLVDGDDDSPETRSGRADVAEPSIPDIAEPSIPDDVEARPAGPGASPGSGPPVPADEDVPTVLLIDDNPDLCAYVSDHLRAAAYRVIEARTGDAGLERARDVVPDCIISDIMMPGLDGHALCRAIRADPELDFVPVILLTARADREHRLEGLSDGADDYLTKPFDMAELVARVDNLIASRHRLREHFGRHRELRPPPVDPPSTDDAFLERVRDALEAHLADDEFSVERLAEEVSYSRSQLYRRIRDTLDRSPSEVIQTFRLQRAADLLAARAGTVSEIAYGVGFKSVSHFCRRFRAHYGVSPSAYTRTAEQSSPSS